MKEFVIISIGLLVTLALVLVCAIIGLLCFSRIAYMLYRAASLIWHSRANLNPRTHRGRWGLLGIALSSMFLICVLLAFFATRQQEEPIFGNLVAPPNYPRADGRHSKAMSLKEQLKERSSMLRQIVDARAEYRQRLQQEILLEKRVGLAVGFIGGVICGFFAFRCFLRAKRFAVRPASELLPEDGRPPVLYLRSFEDDSKVAKQMGMAGFSINTEEGEIAEIVRAVGPLLAIGRPGEELSYFGAARVYVGEGQWQERISQLLSEASLVIARAGRTAGLSWEIEQCAKRVQPERLIVLIALNRRRYDEFRERTAEFFPCRLPEYNGTWFWGPTTVRAILYFDSDWTPHMMPIVENWLSYVLESYSKDLPWDREQSEMRCVLEKVLQPLLQRLMAKPIA